MRRKFEPRNHNVVNILDILVRFYERTLIIEVRNSNKAKHNGTYKENTPTQKKKIQRTTQEKEGFRS